MKGFRWVGVSVLVCASLVTGAFAQDFPKGPVNYMNPFNPGGEVDIAARAMQP